MKTKEAIEYFGSKAKLAEALKIGRSAVSQWGEEVPRGRQFEIQFITDGALRAAELQPKAA